MRDIVVVGGGVIGLSIAYEPCSRKGVCCECLQYHWRMQELPACLFPDEIERTYDRSLRRFIEVYKDKI